MKLYTFSFAFFFTWLAAVAQTPVVRMSNLSRPASTEFQIGDRFEIQITGAPLQPISLRTLRQGETDWSPVIGSTDNSGHWSTTGQFEKQDFGSWSELWTVGNTLAPSATQFNVTAPCLPNGRGLLDMSGMNMMLQCDTPDGQQVFGTPSSEDSFRTADGRTVPPRSRQQTQEQYHQEILSAWITGGGSPGALSSSRGGRGDETAALIRKLIGPNALSEKETLNVLAIIHGAFANPSTIAPDARTPTATLAFLQDLSDRTASPDLQLQLNETIAYVQTRIKQQ